MSMENSSMMIQKGLETVANVTKMAANISGNAKPRNDRKPEHKPEPKNETKDNQLHNQTVEVKVGGDEKQKPETHIHKIYPDNRELSHEECELERMRIQLEYEEKDKQRKHILLVREMDYKERMEREAREKDEREKLEKKLAKKRRLYYLIGGGIGVAVLGLAAYGIYTDNRDSQSNGNTSGSLLTEGTEKKKYTDVIESEGSVE